MRHMGKAESEARRTKLQGHIRKGRAHLEAARARDASIRRHLERARTAIEERRAGRAS